MVDGAMRSLSLSSASLRNPSALYGCPATHSLVSERSSQPAYQSLNHSGRNSSLVKGGLLSNISANEKTAV